ncbi:MAG: TIGR04211 family SH3 domain-containing protein [Candidatus Competibacteraceae bacterium]
MTRWLFILCLLLSLPSLVQAETIRYVNENAPAALRIGAGPRFKIVKSLPGGTAVTVLQVDEKKGFSMVRTQEGVSGWVATRELTDTPSTRQRLADLQQNVERLKAENARLQQAFGGADVASRYSQLLEENERLGQEVARLRKLTGGNFNLDEQNRILQERIVNLERDLQIAQQERQSMADSRQNTLFLLGAGVLLAGLVLGWLLPGRSAAKSSSWREL